MPTWGQELYELQRLLRAQEAELRRPGARPPDPADPSPFDKVRRKYLAELADHTKRPVIVYASGWLEGRPVADVSAVSVSSRDVMGFMEAVHGLEPGPLDLILHSPGGDSNAAEQIMKYLRDYGFGPIRAIIPLSAMSAASMMALCCDEILMAHHSQMGPIDPQFTLSTPDGPRQAPAQAILDQFELAKKEISKDQTSLGAWLPILRSYLPGLLSQCLTAQTAAEEMVAKAMQTYMFADLAPQEREARAKAIAAWFNDHKTHQSHGRPLRYEDVKGRDVKVTLLEDDDDLQEKVLSAWHGVQLTLSQVSIGKIIENHLGKAWMLSAAQSTLQIALGSPPAPRPDQAPVGTQAKPPRPQVNRPSRSERRRKR